MTWADQTYWVRSGAVVVEDGAAELLGPDAVAVRAHSTCGSCPYQDPCMSSIWNEGIRMGGPSQPAPLTWVHSCRVCGNRMLTGIPAAIHRRIVPQRCPRWNPIAGSALDCDGCTAERDAMRDRSPRHAQQKQVLGRTIMAALANGDHLAIRRSFIGFSQVMFPSPDAWDNREAVEIADRVMEVLLHDISNRFSTALASCTVDQRMLNCSLWEECIYLSAVHFGPDQVEIVREFILEFTWTPPFGMAWVKQSVPARKMIRRVWEGLVRGALMDGHR